MFIRIKSLFILLIMLFLTGSLCGYSIKNINIQKTNNNIYLSAKIDQDIPDEVFEYLHNGVKVTIVYEINLYRKTPFYYLADSKLKGIVHKKVVKFNMWDKAYYLFEDKTKSKFKTRKAINEKLKQLDSIYIIKENKLAKDEDYYIKVKALLESVKLFPPLSWIVGLVTTLDFETSWETIEIK